MRVIGGRYRNRNLRAGDGIRPTTDRARETLFNILQNDVAGSIFVDCFAGSGAVGIEAISRGAAMVYFIETSRKSLRILEGNLGECCQGDRWRIFTLDAFRALELVLSENPGANILFYDPPYKYSSYTDLLTISAKLFPDAIHVVESSGRSTYQMPEGLEAFKQRDIGETRLCFFRKIAAG